MRSTPANDNQGRERDATTVYAPPWQIVWLLLIAGLVVIGLGLGLRAVATTTSRTTERVAGKETKVTTIQTPFSDTLLVAALGLGGAFVLCGAFYQRIIKVSFAGATVEFAQAQVEASKAMGRLIAAGGITLDSPEAAANAGAAANLAAARGLEITALANREPSLAQSLVAAANVDVDVRTIAKQKRLPPELWDHLARSALEEVLREKPNHLEPETTSAQADKGESEL